MNIPITKPVFGAEEFEAVLEPLRSGWVVQGPKVAEFENRIAQYVGLPHAVATSSCTTALHLMLVALEVRPGDEVIVPAFTWVATANVVEYVGAKPVFCDIDLNTFNLDIEKLPGLVTPKTVGILPVHLFGLPARMQAIAAFAQEHRLWIVEDCACALGSRIDNAHVGAFGQGGCFSFHPRKCITTGEGGMVVTRQKSLAQKIGILRNHGASVSDFSRHAGKHSFRLAEFNLLGYNYRMTDLQGALGAAQVHRLDWILQQRQMRARNYMQELQEIDWLKLPETPAGYTHAFQSFVCM
ncbi:MAG: DegT/DnrJ/EryC1/StrS family aminotransferase, partial [Calditrichaeota bacterium]